jgi:hypothetical protein
MLVAVFDFLAQLWTTIEAALRLSPELPRRLAAEKAGDMVVVALAVLAGGSLLAGQSVILFVNRLRPGRFVFSLAFHGAIFALELAFWAATVWLCACLLFGSNQPIAVALRIVGLGSAPLLFGILVAVPYLGTPIAWGLRIWSLLVMLMLVRATFGYAIWQALLCAALGWLLIQATTHLAGRPLAALRDWLWRVATGTAFDTNEQALVAAATRELRAQLAALGQQDYGQDLATREADLLG